MSRAKKWTIISIVVVFGLIVTYGALIPTILSTEGGKQFVVRLFEKTTGGKITIQDLSLSWMGKQRIDEFTFNDGKGTRLGFKQLESSCSFWNILLRSGNIGKTEVQSPWIAVQARTEAPRAKPSEKGEKKKKQRAEFWSNYSGKITAINGVVDLLSGGRNLVSMKEVYLELDTLKSSNNFTLIAHGKTQENQLVGSFNIDTKFNEWIEGVASVNNFPVKGLDQVVSVFNPKYQGRLLAALGETLNVNLNAVVSGETQHMALNIRSPLLLVNLNTALKNSLLTLTEESRFVWTVKPKIFNAFIDGAKLQNDAQTELLLQSAALPLSNWDDLAAKGNFYFSGGNLFFEEIKQVISISELSSNFVTSKLSEFLSVNFRSSMSYASSSLAQVAGKLSVRNPLEKNRSYPLFDLEIDNFPLALIDTWKKSETVKYLGGSGSGRLMRSESKMIISANTPLLRLPQMEFEVTDVARLIQSAPFTYVIGQGLYDQLIQPATLSGMMSTLIIPMKKGALDFSRTNFDLQLKIKQLGLQNLFALGALSLPFVDLDVKGTDLKNIEFNGTSRLDFSPQTWGLSLIGSNVGVKTSGRLKWDEEIEVSPLLVQFDGKKFKAKLDASIEKRVLILKKPLTIDFLLEPEQVNAVLAKGGEYPLLSKPTTFHLEVSPSRLPLSERALSSLALKVRGRIDNLAMYSPANGYPFNFQNVNIDFDMDGKRESQLFHFEATALEKGTKAGQLELELSSTGKVTNLINSPTKIKATMKDFSSQIADAFFGTRGQLPDMIGPSLNLDYLMSNQSDRQNIDLKIDSRDFSLDGAFTVGDQLELRTPRKPLKIRWDISEKSYDAFQRWRAPGTPETPNNPLFEIQDNSI